MWMVFYTIDAKGNDCLTATDSHSDCTVPSEICTPPPQECQTVSGTNPGQSNENCVLPQHCSQKMENETALNSRLRGSVVRRTALGGNKIFIRLPWGRTIKLRRNITLFFGVRHFPLYARIHHVFVCGRAKRSAGSFLRSISHLSSLSMVTAPLVQRRPSTPYDIRFIWG
jgi:hypothetical protein